MPIKTIVSAATFPDAMEIAVSMITNLVKHEIDGVGVRHIGDGYDTLVFYRLGKDDRVECWEKWNNNYFKSNFTWYDKFFDWKFRTDQWKVLVLISDHKKSK